MTNEQKKLDARAQRFSRNVRETRKELKTCSPEDRADLEDDLKFWRERLDKVDAKLDALTSS